MTNIETAATTPRKLYKLTSGDMLASDKTVWTLGEWHERSGVGPIFSGGWIHAYEDPLIAVFMNPAHADIFKPRMFVAEGAGAFLDDRGLICGVSRLRIIRELEMPVISSAVRVRTAILCAQHVPVSMERPDNNIWSEWASNWLKKDPVARSEKEIQRVVATTFDTNPGTPATTARSAQYRHAHYRTARCQAAKAARILAMSDNCWGADYAAALSLDWAVRAETFLDLKYALKCAIREAERDHLYLSMGLDNGEGSRQCV